MGKLKLFISFQAIIVAIFIWNITLSTIYSVEFTDAYNFAYKNGITTMNSIDKADMNWWLTRIAMAKMLSQYAINILWKTPDKSKTITFPDVSSKLDNDYNNWVTLAYQLWIMWIWIDKFRPYDSVTRAEFGTALSRVLYGDAYNQNWNNYYSKHLDALKNAWIMTKIDTPFQSEIRWYVMLMLMRSKKSENAFNDLYPTIDPSEIVCTKAGYYPAKFYSYNKKIIKWDCYPKGTKISDMESPVVPPMKPDDANCSYKFKWWEWVWVYIGRTASFEWWEIRAEFECINKKNNENEINSDKSNSKETNDFGYETRYWNIPESKTYTVTRKDTDWSILQQNDLKDGDNMPVYKGLTPKKNNYVFIWWEWWISSEQFKDGKVRENMVFSAIFSDDWVEVPSVAKYAGSWCKKYTDSPRYKFKRDYKGITFLNLPKQVVKDWWYFIWCDNAVNNGSNDKDSSTNNSSTNNSQSDNTQTNNETNNNENTNTQSNNTSTGNTTQNDENNDNESNSNDNENNNESNNSESSDNSNNSSNCVDIEVDDWNSYNFCIVKWKSNGSKYSIKVDNAKDLSLCSVWYSKSGQSWDFYDCDWDITNWKDSWILYDVTLLIKYNWKNYFSEKLNYDLTNWVFVDN